MKKTLLFIALIFTTFLSTGQSVVYTMNGSGGNTITNGNNVSYACSGLQSSVNIAFIAEQIIGSNSVKFYIAKKTVSSCSPGGDSNFSSVNGIWKLYENGSLIHTSAKFYGSKSSPGYTKTMSFTSGVKNYTALYDNGAGLTWSISAISVTAVPNCPNAPSGLYASNITETSYTANWNSVSGASSYDIESVISSSGYTSNKTNVTGTTKTFTNLIAGETYKFQVGTRCSNGADSDMSPSINPYVQLLTPLSISLNSPTEGQDFTPRTAVFLSWAKTSGASALLYLRDMTTGSIIEDYTDFGDISNRLQQNLEKGHTYQWRIRVTKSGSTTVTSLPQTFSIQESYLAVSGSVSPTSGIVNSTNFTFSATLDNVSASPSPSVDIELKAPDTNIYPIYGITNTSGYNFSHTQTLEQVGTYRYRFVGKQGTRANAYSHSSDTNTWPTITVTNNPITVVPYTVTPTTGTQNYTTFKFQAGFTGGDGSATGIDFSFKKPDGTYTTISNGSSEVSFNSSTNRWELNKTMQENGTYQYKYTIYQGATANSSSDWYDLTVSPPITVSNITSPLNFHCIKTFNWSSVGVNGNVSIELYRTGWDGDAKIATIADGVTNSGSFDWVVGRQVQDFAPFEPNIINIPNFLTNGNFKLKMYPTGTTGQATWSNIFTINDPNLVVNTPTTQTFYNGQTIPVTWTSNNFCRMVTVEITDVNGENQQVIGQNIPYNGFFNYTIPTNFPPGNYKIKVYATVTSGASPAWDLSDAFTIANQSVDVPSPAENSTHYYGANLPITWHFVGGYTGDVSIELVQGPTSTVGYRTLFDPTTNDESETWVNIPTDIPAGPYRIKIYNTGAGSIVGYSGVFNIGQDPNCPICLSSSMSVADFAGTGIDGYCAAQYLCSLEIIRADQNLSGATPIDKLRRDDAANMIVKALLRDTEIHAYNINPGTVDFPVSSLHTPFDDINNSSAVTNYNRAAKVLIYLFWADDETFTTPFRKAGTNFYPSKGIARIDFLKLLCESFNLPLTFTDAIPFSDVGEVGEKNTKYLKTALHFNIITSQTNFRPYDEIKREEAFLMLKRLRTNSAINIPGKDELIKPVHYLFEQNVTHDNISIMKSMASGNFAYSENGFSLPDVGLPLSFGFTYSSTITDWPDVYRTVEPLGAGWTHNFNSYIYPTEKSINGEQLEEGESLLLLANGDGTFHTYRNNNPDSPIKRSIDNFNELSVIKSGSTITAYEVKRLDLVKFRYEKITVNAVTEDFYRLTSIKDRYDNTITLTYEQAVNVAANDPVKHRLKSVTGQSGRKVNFEYDTKNLLSRVKFPGKTANDERMIKFSYHPAWDEPKSDRLQKFFSARQANNFVKATTYDYGTNSASKKQGLIITSVKYPKGNSIKLSFDGKNRLETIEEKAGNEILNTSTYIRENVAKCGSDPNCTQITTTDNNKYIHKYNNQNIVYDISGYNSAGQQLVVIQRPENDINPSNPSWFKVNGLKHGYRYSLSGQLLVDSTFDKNGNFKFLEKWLYNPVNNDVAEYWEPNANGSGTAFIKYNYSADGKYLQSVVQSVSHTTSATLTTTYNQHPNGKLAYMIDNESLRTNYYYDALWNNDRIEYVPLGLNTRAEFDYSGRIKNTTNAKNQKSFVEFDDNDNPTKTIAPTPLSYVTQMAYDDNDNPITITNARGKVTQLTYDRYDRDSTITFEGATQKYFYNTDPNSAAYGKMAQIRKPAYNQASNPDYSRKFDFTYDSDGFFKSNGYIYDVTYNKTATNAEKNTLLAIKGGNKLSDLQNLTGFKYDELIRLNEYTDHYGNVVKYVYDNNGNVKFMIYPNTKVAEYQYDRIGRLRKVIWQTNTVAEYVYVGSRLDYTQYGNGIRTKYNYDNAGRISGIRTLKSNGTGAVITDYSYEFDNMGNHITENMTEPFATQPTLTTDHIVSTYNDANQIQTADNVSFTHDGDGNIITKGNTAYRYDLEDNLVEIKVNGVVVASFEYDAFGNRRKAIRNSTETRYILDVMGLADVLATTDANNTIQHYYIHGLGLLARADANGNLEYYHPDYRGSIIAMTNGAADYTHKYQYDDFGTVLNEWAASGAANNPFKYVGAYGIMYETADLFFMRARYYDPTIGRFNSADPIWSTNLYPYANNNGMMNVDASGLLMIELSYCYSASVIKGSGYCGVARMDLLDLVYGGEVQYYDQFYDYRGFIFENKYGIKIFRSNTFAHPTLKDIENKMPTKTRFINTRYGGISQNINDGKLEYSLPIKSILPISFDFSEGYDDFDPEPQTYIGVSFATPFPSWGSYEMEERKTSKTERPIYISEYTESQKQYLKQPRAFKSYNPFK